MFTPEHFRAKAAEYKELAKTAFDSDDACEFERRARSFIVLADNEQWLADHHAQTLHATDAGGAHVPAARPIGHPISGAAAQ
jgi:hypothetical protein